MERLVEVTLEIDAELKEQAEKVFAENGMTLEEATILFFEETVRLGRLPFELDDDLSPGRLYLLRDNLAQGRQNKMHLRDMTVRRRRKLHIH